MQRMRKIVTICTSILLLLVSLLLAGIVGAEEKKNDELIQEMDSTYHPENMGDGAGQGGSSSIKGQHGDRSITGSGSRRNTLRMHKDPGPGL